jgi:hypothetical protein
LSVVQQADTLSICVGDPVTLSANEATGGSGVYTYQWQSSPDGGVSGWTDIVGATSSTYLPTTANTGTYYYRRVTGDGVCSSVNSGVTTLIIKHCYIPVNPQLMNKPE